MRCFALVVLVAGWGIPFSYADEPTFQNEKARQCFDLSILAEVDFIFSVYRMNLQPGFHCFLFQPDGSIEADEACSEAEIPKIPNYQHFRGKAHRLNSGLVRIRELRDQAIQNGDANPQIANDYADKKIEHYSLLSRQTQISKFNHAIHRFLEECEVSN